MHLCILFSRLGAVARRDMKKKSVTSLFIICQCQVAFFQPIHTFITWLLRLTACLKLSGTSLIRSSSLFEWDEAGCDLCWLLVTALSKSRLFMFNQEDQLPAHSIITLWKAHNPICSWESAVSRAIDRQSSAISVNHGCTPTRLLPSYQWCCASVFNLASVIAWK